MKVLLEQRRYLVGFDSRRMPHVFTDVLVVGSGVAGLRAAIEAAKYGQVLVISKNELSEGNTFYAQGGIAVALGPADSVEAHIRDTLAAGCGLCDEAVVRMVAGEAPRGVLELVDWGATFDREDGELALGREGGHSAARIVHARGDATGREVEQTLLARVSSEPRIQLVDHSFCVDLITIDGVCKGALIAERRWGRMLVWSRALILATGGRVEYGTEYSLFGKAKELADLQLDPPEGQYNVIVFPRDPHL